MQADNEQLPTTPGAVIAGKYRVDSVIGEGGMGAIVKARHISLNRVVAIKLMRSEISGVHKASERFLREARATANIDSDYVARVSDIDVLPSGIPFIVMEFLNGVDLGTHVGQVRQRDIVEAVDWILQALAGLVAAHALGIVHRDLKPSNLFLVKRPDGGWRLKVLDFGVSKVLDDSDFSREGHNDGLTTATNFVVGTPRYMAPEQITAPREVDERADLWAMGLMLYEFLVGAHPFDGKTPGAIMGNVLAAPILPVDSYRADVPIELSKVVERCLQRDRNQRIPSANELLRALAPFGSPQLAQSLVAALPPPPAARRTADEISVVPARTPNLGGFAAVQPGAAVAQVGVAKIGLGSFGSGNSTGVEAGPPPSVGDYPEITVRTPTPAPGLASSLAIPVSVATAAGTPAPSATPTPAASSGEPGTLLEWNQERGRERPRTALLLGGFVALGGALAGWFFVAAQRSVPPPADYSQDSPVPSHQAAPTPVQPPPADPPVADPSPPAAPGPAPAAVPAPAPEPTPAAASPTPPAPAVAPATAPAKAKSKARPGPAPTPAAPAPPPVVAQPEPPAPAPPPPAAAPPAEGPKVEETKKSKDSILGTRN